MQLFPAQLHHLSEQDVFVFAEAIAADKPLTFWCRGMAEALFSEVWWLDELSIPMEDRTRRLECLHSTEVFIAKDAALKQAVVSQFRRSVTEPNWSLELRQGASKTPPCLAAGFLGAGRAGRFRYNSRLDVPVWSITVDGYRYNSRIPLSTAQSVVLSYMQALHRNLQPYITHDPQFLEVYLQWCVGTAHVAKGRRIIPRGDVLVAQPGGARGTVVRTKVPDPLSKLEEPALVALVDLVWVC